MQYKYAVIYQHPACSEVQILNSFKDGRMLKVNGTIGSFNTREIRFSSRRHAIQIAKKIYPSIKIIDYNSKEYKELYSL